MALKPTKKSQWFSNLPRVAAELVTGVDAAIVKGAELVKEDADQRLEPHRLTGELERQTHVDDRKAKGVYVVAGDPKDPTFAFWGSFLEHGTSHAPAYPFLVPALEAKQGEVVGLVHAAIRAIR